MRARISTVQLLARQSLSRQDANVVVEEFQEVIRIAQMMPLRRRCLIQVLFSTRAIDTALRNYIASKGIPATPRSIGESLHVLVSHQVTGISRLSERQYRSFQSQIAHRRNRYMHAAGAFPAGVQEVTELLGAMEACLTRVFAL